MERCGWLWGGGCRSNCWLFYGDSMKAWSFTFDWRGQHGEYWVLAQALLFLGFALLPVYRSPLLQLTVPTTYFIWAMAAGLGLGATVLLLKGLVDLGRNLTPLPYPVESGELVRSGIYSFVRHPLYSGVILAALSWAVFQLSLSHLLGTIALFLFFDAKANREENWLLEKYPDYADYRQQVKKLLPWLY